MKISKVSEKEQNFPQVHYTDNWVASSQEWRGAANEIVEMIQAILSGPKEDVQKIQHLAVEVQWVPKIAVNAKLRDTYQK